MQFVKSAFSLVVLACLIAGVPRSLSAQASVITESLQFPFAVDVFVPCANNGAGEIVRLLGTLHEVFHIAFDAAGGVHLKSHDQPQGMASDKRLAQSIKERV